jgi:4-amino-4-deoxy-L-arabinose transferase-like glycosyltransferase
MSAAFESIAAASAAPVAAWEATLRLRRRAGLMVTLGLLLFGAVWLAHLSYTSLSPPTDNIEQLIWLHSLEWGYYKHPPLPTWLVWVAAQLFGVHAWTTYLTGAALTLGSLGLLWCLLSQLRGYRYATLALLAVLCITYYNGRLNYCNHNTVLMFWVTVSAGACWRACTGGQLRCWLALGAALGLGALSKYQIAVTTISVLCFWLHQRGWRDARQRCGLMMAALVALLICVPHLLWLRTHDFGPLQYAKESSLGAHLGVGRRWGDALHWTADQVLNRAMPAWLLLAAALYAGRRRIAAAAWPALLARRVDGDDRARALLLSWGLVPLAFMPVVGIFTGADLQLQWGTAFLLFAVPAAMELAATRVAWTRAPLRPTLKVFITLQLLLLVQSHLVSPRGPAALRDRHWRSFDSAALAGRLEAPARQALPGQRICVVSGPDAEAGALALQLTDRPLVLIDGRFDRSPWVSADQVKRCSVLELNRGAPLPGGQPVGAGFEGLSWRVVLPTGR